jgi:hypothetical protein
MERRLLPRLKANLYINKGLSLIPELKILLTKGLH